MRDIPPGGEGRIKVTIYTSAYGGQKVRKRITVRTNENVDTRHYLYMSGIVDHFASITPEYVHLTGLPGEPVQEQVTILPSEKYPFSIISTRARWGTNMIYDLVPNPEGAGYILIVTNTKDVTGSYRDIIYLATDSTLKRELRVFVRGTIYAPVKKTSQETVPRGSEQNSVLQ